MAEDNTKKKETIIKTMPEYFRTGQYLKEREARKRSVVSSTRKKTTKNIYKLVLLILVISVILGGSAYGLYLYMNSQKQRQILLKNKLEQEKLRQKQLAEQRKQEELLRKQEEEQRKKQEQEKIKRDEQRIKDIIVLQTALEKYFKLAGHYPEELNFGESLEYKDETFLIKVPQDPLPDVSNYSYTVDPSDKLSYTLSFTLESGFGALKKGLVTVSSERILGENGQIKQVPSKREIQKQVELILPSLDTDQDGLTDIEETLLYSTNKNEFDTDGDGYSDKQELLNLYNPSGLAPIRLIDSGNVKDFENKNYKYKIYYPTKWKVKSLDGSEKEVLFTSTTGEFIEVIVTENTKNLSLDEWFKQNFGEQVFKTVLRVKTKSGLVGLRSLDRRTVYFARGKYIFAITHNIGTKKQMDYGVTFEMMVKSFRILSGQEENQQIQSKEKTEQAGQNIKGSKNKGEEQISKKESNSKNSTSKQKQTEQTSKESASSLNKQTGESSSSSKK